MNNPYGMWGMIPPMFSIPNILPSSSLLNANPAGAIRDFTEHVISGYRDHMAPPREMKILEDWCKTEEYRKVILEVVKARLELGWPYNYKALDVLSLMPAGDVLGLLDIVTKLNDAPAGTEGGAELKKLAKPLIDKAQKEKEAQEEESAKKQQEAIAAMWGGLWHNAPTQGQAAAAYAGGWQLAYPWAGAPGVAAAAAPGAGAAWGGKPPEGWTPWVLTAVPMPPAPVAYGGGGGGGGAGVYGAYPYAYGGVPKWPHERS